MRRTWIIGTVILLTAALGIAAALAARNARETHEAGASASAGPAHKQLWRCGMHPQVIQDHPGECPICGMALTPFDPNSASSLSSELRIDPAVVQNMGVRTAPVTKGTLTKTVRTVGLLSLPEPGMRDVSLKVGGWIDKLYADQEGMHVHQGEPLFEVYSPELQVAEQELISAVKSQRVLGANVSPVLRQESQNLIDSAKRKLRLWDVDEKEIEAIAQADQPPRDVVFRSPASGHVEEKMVVQGSSVQPGMKLLRIADHTKVWLDAQVYEEQVPFVKQGAKVIAHIDGILGKTFAGTVTFIYPHLDHMSRTLKVRVTLDNPDFELKPGMYATVEIATEPVQDAILCPREAVIDTGTRQVAFIAGGDGHFSLRNVRIGLIGDDDKVQILEGLAPGETVVTSGQFLLDVESRLIEATEKLSGATTRPATTDAAVLTRVRCPMTKFDWLQVGEQIRNPYEGQAMPDCGDVRGKVSAPQTGSAVAELVSAYLTVQRALNEDRIDATALNGVKVAAEKLDAAKYDSLHEASNKLADAKDLKSAREAFKALSDQVIKILPESKP